jgi:hypothetical protein
LPDIRLVKIAGGANRIGTFGKVKSTPAGKVGKWADGKCSENIPHFAAIASD